MKSTVPDPIRELARMLAERIVDDLLREETNPQDRAASQPPEATDRQAPVAQVRP